MKHAIFGKKLSRNTNERKQLFRNLIKSIVAQSAITTTEAKAKAVKPQLEHLITIAKKQDLHSFKRLVQETGDIKVAKKLKNLGVLFQTRPGGYTRIIKLAASAGNNGSQVRFELVERLVEAEEVTVQTTKSNKDKKKTRKIASYEAKETKK